MDGEGLTMNSHNPSSFYQRSRLAMPRPEGSAATFHAEPPRAPAKTLSSKDLFEGAFEIGIDHRGAIYRLKITRQGKLILNK
jgi:hemin uptake protein HemP